MISHRNNFDQTLNGFSEIKSRTCQQSFKERHISCITIKCDTTSSKPQHINSLSNTIHIIIAAKIFPLRRSHAATLIWFSYSWRTETLNARYVPHTSVCMDEEMWIIMGDEKCWKCFFIYVFNAVVGAWE